MKAIVRNIRELDLLGFQCKTDINFTLTQWCGNKPAVENKHYTTVDTYYVKFKDSVLTSFPSVVITPDHHAYYDGISRFAGGRFANQHFWKQLAKGYDETDFLIDSVVELDHPIIGFFNNKNLFHWVCENLPKIKYIEDHDIPGKLITQPLDQYQKETLQYFPSVRDRILEIDQPIAVKSPYIYMISTPAHDAGKICDWVVPYLRSKFIINDVVPTDNIYISRKDAQGRNILNESELEPILKKHKFKFINLRDYSFEQKIAIFQRAKFIAGPHGAGLTNSLWCQPNKSKVLELMFAEVKNQFWFSCPASLNSIDYHLLLGQAQGPLLKERNMKRKNRDMVVSPDDFKNVLEVLL